MYTSEFWSNESQFKHNLQLIYFNCKDYWVKLFKLLPSKGEKNFNTALNIMTYTLFLIPLGLLPTVFGITGIISGAIAVICAIYTVISILIVIIFKKSYKPTMIAK